MSVSHSATYLRSQARRTPSSSTKTVKSSSPRTIRRFPSPRRASATKIVEPSAAVTVPKPQLQPWLARLFAIISQYFTMNDFITGFANRRSRIRILSSAPFVISNYRGCWQFHTGCPNQPNAVHLCPARLSKSCPPDAYGCTVRRAGLSVCTTFCRMISRAMNGNSR